MKIRELKKALEAYDENLEIRFITGNSNACQVHNNISEITEIKKGIHFKYDCEYYTDLVLFTEDLIKTYGGQKASEIIKQLDLDGKLDLSLLIYLEVI